jgi:TP901-1 family phage major tail protein
MAKLAGVDVLLQVESETPGTYVIVGGQSGATLNRSTNVVDTTSKDANGWAENVAGVNSWSLECEGFIVVDDDAYGLLETAWETRATVKAQILYPNGQKYSGDCIISDFPMEYPQDGAATFSISLTGTGVLTKTAGS